MQKQTILERIAAGEHAAVKDCQDTYGGLIWSLARRYFNNPADAEDATQDVLISIWTAADRFNPSIASETTFISMLARRRIIDKIRRAGRRPAMASLDAEDSVALQPTVAGGFEAASDLERVAEVVEAMRPAFSDALTLSLCEGYSHQEISDKLKVPLGTIKTRIRRSMAKLREELPLAA